MKKLICVLTLFALVLSFCACGQTPEETEPATEPSVPETTERQAARSAFAVELA